MKEKEIDVSYYHRLMQQQARANDFQRTMIKYINGEDTTDGVRNVFDHEIINERINYLKTHSTLFGKSIPVEDVEFVEVKNTGNE